eukprot:3182111-Pyramimonas_sp.AAC.2
MMRSFAWVCIVIVLLGCASRVSSKIMVAVQTHGASSELVRRVLGRYAFQAKQDSVSQRYDFVVLHDSTRVKEDTRNDTWKTVDFSTATLMKRFPKYHLCQKKGALCQKKGASRSKWRRGTPTDPTFYCRYVMHTPAFAVLLDQVDERGYPYEAFWIIEYDCMFKGNMYDYIAEKDEGEFKDADLVEDFYQMTSDYAKFKELYYDKHWKFIGFGNTADGSVQGSPSSGEPYRFPLNQSLQEAGENRKNRIHVPLKEQKAMHLKFSHAVSNLLDWGTGFGFDLGNIVSNNVVWKAHEHVLRFSRKYLTFLTNLNELGFFQHGEYMIPTMCHYTSHKCVHFNDKGIWRYKPSLDLTQWSTAVIGKWHHPVKLDDFGLQEMIDLVKDPKNNQTKEEVMESLMFL